jgi:hypothetical protein
VAIDDPLDEYEATLREAHERAERVRSGRTELEEQMLRQLRHELASALDEAADHARRHSDE